VEKTLLTSVIPFYPSCWWLCSR